MKAAGGKLRLEAAPVWGGSARRETRGSRRSRLHPLQIWPGTALAAWTLALHARQRDASLHSLRVASYAGLLAWRMGVGSHELEVIRQGALLHDVGKIGISDSVLRKPGSLGEEEWEQMRRHPETGYRMLRSAGYSEEVANPALSHHERFDGRGYPQGLSGNAIPLAAKIVSLADAFDAMTTDRCYRKGVAFVVARQEIENGAGRQFDPIVVGAFLRIPLEEWAAAGRQPYSALSPLHSLLPATADANRMLKQRLAAA